MLNCKRVLLLFLILSLFPLMSYTPTLGQEAEEDTMRSITAIRVNPGAKIDGVFDEEFWQKAPRSGEFIQFQPDLGEPSSESISFG